MGRPAKLDRPVEKSISIPGSIHTRLELLLFSELEGRVPHGAWSKLVEGLLRDYLERVQGMGAGHNG